MGALLREQNRPSTETGAWAQDEPRPGEPRGSRGWALLSQLHREEGRQQCGPRAPPRGPTGSEGRWAERSADPGAGQRRPLRGYCLAPQGPRRTCVARRSGSTASSPPGAGPRGVLAAVRPRAAPGSVAGQGHAPQSLTSRPRAGSGLGPPAAHRARLQARHSVRLKVLVRLEQRHAQARSLPCPGSDLGPGELYSPDGPDLCDLPMVLLLSDKPERGDTVGRGRRAGGDTGAQSGTNCWKVKLRQVLDRSGFPQPVVRWSPRARRGLTWPPQPRPPSGTVACAAPSLLTVDAGGWGLAWRCPRATDRATEPCRLRNSLWSHFRDSHPEICPKCPEPARECLWSPLSRLNTEQWSRRSVQAWVVGAGGFTQGGLGGGEEKSTGGRGGQVPGPP